MTAAREVPGYVVIDDFDQPPPGGQPPPAGGDRPPPSVPDYREPYGERERHKDHVRKLLALSLVALVALDLVLAWLAGAEHWATWPEVKEFITNTLPVLVAFAGTAVGFYFAKD